MSGSEANRELIVVTTTDHGGLIGIFSNPDYPFGVDKDFHAVHVFKHYKIHVASLGYLIMQTLVRRFRPSNEP
jgi:hypothetical protein